MQVLRNDGLWEHACGKPQVYEEYILTKRKTIIHYE
jgi:hypothetical protein